MKSLYPVVPLNADKDDILDFLRQVSRLRQMEDLPDFTALNQNFVSGRSTTRVPSGPTDVDDTDVLGDIVYASDGSYVFILVSVSGVATWARVALDTSWT